MFRVVSIWQRLAEEVTKSTTFAGASDLKARQAKVPYLRNHITGTYQWSLGAIVKAEQEHRPTGA
jgi:hypothetical protein